LGSSATKKGIIINKIYVLVIYKTNTKYKETGSRRNKRRKKTGKNAKQK
jgi:hypothetical protein